MKILFRVLTFIFGHNKNHYIPVKFAGATIHFCTRSLGLFFAFFSLLPFVLAYDFYNTRLYLFTCVSILLVLADILYWMLTRINILKDILTARIITGFLSGAGIILWGQLNLPLFLKFNIPVLFFIFIIWADKRVRQPQ